jgi:Heterokaryon incompatibility protein (HET)
MEAYQRQSRYLTLSHRWSSQLFKLTTDTVHDLRNGLPISRLPKTFQDAIEATRQLRERFLWIDSLCIFQDSVVDWRQQSAKMGDIYFNCYCNLSATAAPDSNSGLFFDRSVTTILPITMSCNWTFPRLSYEKKVEEVSNETCQVHDLALLQTIVEDTCLSSRGWVLQERLLSPPVVHFGRNQIVWECRSQRACETYPGGDPIKLQAISNSTHFWPAKRFANAIQSTTVPMAYNNWRALVELYTDTALTKPEDTLVALSGVAKIMQRVTRDEYIAGLWKENLAHDLLWERVGEINHRPRDPDAPDAWIAPSWSWASSGYFVAYDQGQGVVAMGADIQITLLESHVAVKTWDPEEEFAPMERKMRKIVLDRFRKMLRRFLASARLERSSELTAKPDVTGQLREASLQLKARIFELLCTKNKQFGVYIPTHRSRSIIEVVLDGATYPAWIVFDDPDKQSHFFRFRNALPGSYGQLQFMPTVFNRVEAYGHRWYGLVLEKYDQPDHYIRTGRLEIQISPEKVKQALQMADEGAEVRLVEPDLAWLYMLRALKLSSGERDDSLSGRERTLVLL